MKAVGFITIGFVSGGIGGRRADARGHEGLHALRTLFIVFFAFDEEDGQAVVVAVVSSLLDELAVSGSRPTSFKARSHAITDLSANVMSP